MSYLFVRGQLLFQLLRLLLDGPQVIPYRLPWMHPSVETVEQASPKSIQSKFICEMNPPLTPLPSPIVVSLVDWEYLFFLQPEVKYSTENRIF